MDVLKVFNLIVCLDKNTEKSQFSSSWFFNIMFAPVGILFTGNKFAILAWFTVGVFFLLIYTSNNSFIKLFSTNKDGNLSIWNSLFSAVCLYIFQTVIILLFLRYSICEKTIAWEENDYHLTLNQYNKEDIELESGY